MKKANLATKKVYNSNAQLLFDVEGWEETILVEFDQEKLSETEWWLKTELELSLLTEEYVIIERDDFTVSLTNKFGCPEELHMNKVVQFFYKNENCIGGGLMAGIAEETIELKEMNDYSVFEGTLEELFERSNELINIKIRGGHEMYLYKVGKAMREAVADELYIY